MKLLPLFVLTLCLAARICLAAPESDAELLLREVARHTADTRTLYAAFTQEKRLSILNDPLVSSGHLCLERGPDTASDRVAWMYEQPASSGFAYDGGQGWLWTGERSARRQAQGMEAAALKIATEHILAWVRVRPDALEKLYTMQRLPDTADHCPVLRLTPRRSGAFFAALDVTFTPGKDTVRELRFLEPNGDSTRLLFRGTRVNEVLPPLCRDNPIP